MSDAGGYVGSGYAEQARLGTATIPGRHRRITPHSHRTVVGSSISCAEYPMPFHDSSTSMSVGEG